MRSIRREVDNVGDEARADALDAVMAGLKRFAGEFLRDDGAVGGLDADGDEWFLEVLLDEARDAGDRAARADSGNQRVDSASGVVPDFGPGRAEMNRRVRRVLELLQHHVAVRLGGHHLLGALDGPLHAHFVGRELKLDSEHPKHLLTLETHDFRHRQCHRIAARRGHEGERDAGIAARGLDDLNARFPVRRAARRPRSLMPRCGT